MFVAVDDAPAHYFVRCPMFALERTTLRKISDKGHSDISLLSDDHLTRILLYGSNLFNSVRNKLIIGATTLRSLGKQDVSFPLYCIVQLLFL